MATYKAYVLNKRPTGEIHPTETFRLEERPVPEESSLKDGEILIDVLYLSLDPALRGGITEARSYTPPVPIGGTMRGGVLGRVRHSRSSKYSAGDLVTAWPGWVEVAVLKDSEATPASVPANARTTDAMGVLGATGLTAWIGLLEIGQVKAGDKVVVSGAAGATGSVVVQLALLKGASVVAIAGSADKCAWLRELGCSAALNYKDGDFAQQLAAATPDYIDLYFDNVGGDILDLCLARAAPFSRFVMCGMISQYNSESPVGPKNIVSVVKMRIRMQGFIVLDHADKWPQARKELAGWLEQGKLQRKETVVKGGIEKAPQTLIDLFKGINTGKLLVEIKPEGEASKI